LKQKLEAASSALSGGSYDAAIALAASVINEKLGLDLKIEDLEKLLDSTSTVYRLAEKIQDATFTEDLFDAVKILVEAVAFKTEKDISSLADEVIEILQELGIDLDFTKSKSNGSDFWAEFETNAGTIVKSSQRRSMEDTLSNFSPVGTTSSRRIPLIPLITLSQRRCAPSTTSVTCSTCSWTSMTTATSVMRNSSKTS